MAINESLNLVFIHMPKNAGKTTTGILGIQEYSKRINRRAVHRSYFALVGKYLIQKFNNQNFAEPRSGIITPWALYTTGIVDAKNLFPFLSETIDQNIAVLNRL